MIFFIYQALASELSDFLFHFYRPQRSCGQGNVFTRVCHSVHRGGGGAWGGGGVCLSACWDTTHPPSPEQTPRGADTPQADPPQSRHPPRADTPPSRHPPGEADSGIRSMSCRYASYWNAFVLVMKIMY